VEFQVCPLDELPSLALDSFDVTLFNGLLYHLPNPIGGLELAADRTRELLIVSTAARAGMPDGLLEVGYEDPEEETSGIDGLKWWPTGPRVVAAMLEWLGFPEVRCSLWRPARDPELDRVQVVAARREGALASFDATRGEGAQLLIAIVRTTVPPRSTVLVATGGDDAYLRIPGRQGWHFPRAADGRHVALTEIEDGLVDHLEGLRTAGAGYLAATTNLFESLARAPGFSAHLEARYEVVHRDEHCAVWDLTAKPKPRA
jgi:hypothetical protein